MKIDRQILLVVSIVCLNHCLKGSVNSKPVTFFVPNFTSGTISKYKSQSGFLQKEGTDDATTTQPTSVSYHKGFLFVSNWGADKISSYSYQHSGLILQSAVDLSIHSLSKPHHTFVHKAANTLYVAHESNPGFISAWKIEGDGALSLLEAPYSTGVRTSTLQVSDDLKFLFAASPGDGRIYVFRILQDGRLSGMAQLLIGAGNTGPYAAIPISSKNKLAVMNLDESTLSLFAWNSQTGKIDPLETKVPLEKQSSPRWMCFSRKTNHLYLASSAKNSIYSLNLLEDSPEIKTALTGLSSPRSMTVSPDGSYAVISADNQMILVALADDALKITQIEPAGTLPLFGGFGFDG